MYTLIFAGAFVVGWLVCAYLPWFLLSVATRGRAGLANLPITVVAGVVAALLVPLLGLRDATGLWLSFAVAFAVPCLVLAARRFAQPAFDHRHQLAPAKPQTSERGDR